MKNYSHSTASLQWSEDTLLKGNSVLMPVLTKERADYLYFQAKRRFHRWLKYANRRSRIMEFKNGAILQIMTSAEIGKQAKGTISIKGSNDL